MSNPDGALRRASAERSAPSPTSMELNVSHEKAFWSLEHDNEGFDPVMFPEIKPYLVAAPDDDELGLRHLREWPESLAAMAPARHVVRRRRRRVRTDRVSRPQPGPAHR